MKNMKKFLSVAMAVLLMFTLVISASAKSIFEFSDLTSGDANKDTRDYVASNKYFKDALQMMVDLGIMTGRDNGALDPSASVTRMEFITMLYKFTNGGSEPNSSFADLNPFTDIPWGQAYAGWAYSAGIAAGIGNNKLGSGDKIKMADAVTFLIKALGVNTEYERFTGDTYAIKALTIGNELGIVVGDFNAADNNALTRAEVACLFNFSLSAPMQKYDVAYNGTTAVYTREDTGSAAISKFFGYDRYEGEIVANNLFALDGIANKPAAGKTTLQAHLINGVQVTVTSGSTTTNGVKTLTLPVDVGLTNVGKSFYMYAKLDNTGAISKHSGFNITGTETTYGTGSVYFKDSDAKIYTDKARTSAKKVADAALVESGATTDANIYKNYIAYDGATTALATGADDTMDVVAGVLSGNKLRVVDTDYGTYYFVENLTAAKITAFSSAKYTTALASATGGTKVTIESKYVITGDELAAGDYVLYANIAGGDYYTMTKAELLEGTASAFAAGALKIGGTNYSHYDVTGANDYADISTGADYKFYVVGGKIMGFALVGSTSDSGSDYCWVSTIWKSGTSNPTVEAEVYSAADPSGKIYTVASSSSGYKSLVAGALGKLYKYTISNNNIVLTNPSFTAAQTIALGTGGSLSAYAGELKMKGNAVTTDEYFDVNTNPGSVFFIVGASSVTVSTNRPPHYATQGNTTSTLYLNANKAGTGASAAAPFTGVVKVGVLKSVTLVNPDPIYAWGTASFEVYSDNSGFVNAYNGTKVEKYEFSGTTTCNGNPIDSGVDFDGSVLKIQKDTAGDIVSIDIMTAAETAFAAAGLYALSDIDVEGGSVRFFDATTAAAEMNWLDITTSMKFYLVDQTGDEVSYSNITSTIADFDLDDEALSYSYYAILDSTKTPSIFYIVIE